MADQDSTLLYLEVEMDKIQLLIVMVQMMLCNSSTSTNKTHSNISQKMGGSESLNIANNKDKKPKSTNINQSQQLTLFDFIN
jgi:hypothetical protein